MLAGRGAGKTRAAAEWVREQAETGRARQIALVGETAADVRDVMIEQGDSALLKICPPDYMPRYEPSKRRLTWPNGAVAIAYSAEDPYQLKGPQHDLAWCDEVAAWHRARETWDNLMMGLRISGPLGNPPRVLATTTPRTTELILELARGLPRPDGSRVKRSDVVVTGGSTYDNLEFLDQAFVREMRDRYEGTRIGRQELHAEILEDVDGALWTIDMIDDHRVRPDVELELTRVVVAVDPAASSGSDSSETGIVAVSADARGDLYVLDDRSCRLGPAGWAKRAVELFHVEQADAIVAEVNQGGEMVRHTIHSVDPTVPVRMVRATRGKLTRAEPVAALYEQGRVHHVGIFRQLEDQLCSWAPGAPSPDRLDALVWGCSHLSHGRRPGRVGLRVIGGGVK